MSTAWTIPPSRCPHPTTSTDVPYRQRRARALPAQSQRENRRRCSLPPSDDPYTARYGVAVGAAPPASLSSCDI